MNAAELLGALLKNKSGASGGGGGMLKDLITGALKNRGASAPAPSQPSGGSAPRRRGGDLGDLVRDAFSKFQNRQSGKPAGADCNDPAHQNLGRSGSSELDNEQAVILIRAMINAAKSDGQLDQNEQNTIVKQLGELTQDEVQFLKKEFASPVNVKEFTWSVPMGLEQQVYGLSLMAINLDQNKEASYLKDLAHGLRLDPDICNGIHKQYKAPLIFS